MNSEMVYCAEFSARITSLFSHKMRAGPQGRSMVNIPRGIT